MCEYFWYVANRLDMLINNLLKGAQAVELNNTIDDLKNVQRPLDNLLHCKEFILCEAQYAILQCSTKEFSFVSRNEENVVEEEKKTTKKRGFQNVSSN